MLQLLDKFIKDIKKKYEKIDCLINCAGMWISGDISKLDQPIYNEMNDLFIECNTDCEIYFLDFSLFIQNETNKYTLFLLNKMSSCIRKLNKKSTILQKKSMEDKLLTYFRALAKKENAKRFEVPLTFKDLADYLGVDRSSLMRKLNDLEAKKKIKRSGKTIFLKS